MLELCPNCGGGFAPRPTRPAAGLREGADLAHQPASTKRVYLKYSTGEVAEFVARVKDIAPEHR